MTVSTETLVQIKAALRRIPAGDFAATASGLIDLLGYQSDRIPPGQTGLAADFVGQFRAETPGTKTEKEFLAHDPTVQVLSQVTDSEIDLHSQPQLKGDRYDPANIRSFLFASVDLEGDTYPRGKYAQFAREINKRMSQPTVVLFRTTTGKLTIAFMKRRPDKRDGKRDVLGKVSLIREIDARSPHPAHLRIIAELDLNNRLGWMKSHNKHPNFEGLLEAWLDALDIEALNKQFYRKLFAWFENAVDEARFPTSENPTPEEHIIRLITRLLFIWFIKEKQLVHADLFNEDQMRPLLKGYDRDTGDSYYRAILQNLFFATLNTEIDQRGFNDTGADSDYSRYHYHNEIADPEHLISLFSETPFINGGLFDCLDNPNPTTEGRSLIDCFTEDPTHRDRLSVPNRLFFGPDGLIDLFDDYRFTVEENTPVEQDVALDPELLGKVFENLLAAFNPETQNNARRQTGSYYTPRQVVDYMVTEALVAYWKETVQDDHGAKGFWEERLRYLLDYTEDIDDAGSIFEASEQKRLIENIAHIRMLDPAVGSGAFPMALLHRITLALTRLDPDNTDWMATQKRLAASRAGQIFDIEDRNERRSALLEINDTFERYQSDFGRKLYLIQNSIYGVDIQPIACQIAKLRMFISLAIEQQPASDPASNYGIRPLPNLESKFVAADTLIGLKGQEPLASPHAVDLRRKWAANTEQHFHATTPEQKESLVREDRRLRSELADELRNLGMSPDHTDRIATWDRYDQNTSADWFDPQYMFNTTDGFHIVIGNPPYIQLQRDRGALGKKYKPAGYITFAKTGDIYGLFYERGTQLLTPGKGMLAYITSNSWMKAKYGEKLRSHLSARHTPLKLIEMGKDMFEATVDTNILLLREGTGLPPRSNSTETASFPAVDKDNHSQGDFPPPEAQWGRILPGASGPWSVMTPVEQRILAKMKLKGTPLAQWDVRIYRGVTTGLNDAFIIDSATRDRLVAEDPRSEEILKPILRGRDIRRFKVGWAGLYLIYSHSGIGEHNFPAVRRHLLPHRQRLLARRGGANPRTGLVPYRWWQLQADYYKSGAYANFAKPKLFWMDMAAVGRFAYSEEQVFCNDKGFIMTGESLHYLNAVLNSSLVLWWMEKTALTTGMGRLQWKKFTVQSLPVPKSGFTEQQPYARIVLQILAEKSTDPSADTTKLETEIDRLVYDLYGLSAEEVEAVKASQLARG